MLRLASIRVDDDLLLVTAHGGGTTEGIDIGEGKESPVRVLLKK